MKINVEFDLTPDEFRQSLGLPDVEAFQRNLLENIQRQMESGVEGYDPMSLMRPFLQQPMMQQGLSQGLSEGLSQGLANFGTYQQMMLDMLRQAGSASTKTTSTSSASGSAAEQGGNTGTKSGAASDKASSANTHNSANKSASSGGKTKATASSRSRSGSSTRSKSKRSDA
ncbi:hypothetical protein QEN58_12480 [Halomonas alkaliantarctica]|uniref:Rod binding protein n=1 Tax=Halomonas alkaliantarctica TaxID=232346 RepID=A0ABY8LLF2_9GAMM|nr:hypothetical protein [Halomonas alkaliantarctica]WGI24152.1 hypothetical protein QEN58_12480 [Halomonas alkaliantarctica]